MDQNINNYLSINDILADCLVILDDEDNGKLSPGFYRAQVKNTLDELGFDIDFLPQVSDYRIPSDLMLEMPIGCFNLQTLVIYKGTPDDVLYKETVYWRKGVQTRGKGTGTTANVNADNVSDPFFRVHVYENQQYYFSVQGGIIRLSDACQYFDFARFTYSGVPSMNLDAVKMIPRECRKAITLKTTELCASALKLRDNKYRIIQIDASNNLDEYGMNGAWHECKQRLLRLDTKKLKDVILYNQQLNF
jgi:hypothetical protein